jgi:hypothetical protein
MCCHSVVMQIIKGHSLPVHVSRKEAEHPLYFILLCNTAIIYTSCLIVCTPGGI